MNYQDVLDRLSDDRTRVDLFLEEFRQVDHDLWVEHPDLYVRFCERLIAQGHPSKALDLARESGSALTGNPLLLYRLAQAANRGGNPMQARTIIKPLLDRVLLQPALDSQPIDTKLRVEIVALQGSILKQQSIHAPALARESAEWYERAATMPGASELPDAGTFPLINAATMWRIAGEETKSLKIAKETLDRLQKLPPEEIEADYWMLASQGEANVHLGRHVEAVESYLKAVAILNARNDYGELGAMRRNLQRLQQLGLTADTQFLDEHLGSVVVFSGHLIDSPDRLAKNLPVRFPNDDRLIDAVKVEIQDKLQAINAQVGFSSLAAGGDILFAEAMLERGAELHVLLPFGDHDFRRTSVTFGLSTPSWRRWGRRFEDILERIPKENIRYVTTEPYLGCEELWRYSGTILQGMTLLRAKERVSQPTALLLIDRSIPGMAGGTEEFGETGAKIGLQSEEIDLRALRETHWQPGVRPKEQVQQPPQISKLPRPIKSILFADVQGFSKISEWRMPDFLEEYYQYLRRLRDSAFGKPIRFINTWGDGLYIVFDHEFEAAAYACELLSPRTVPPLDWAKFDLGSNSDVPIRVGLHSGPVFELPDIFQPEFKNYSGQHVNRAARIEPVALRSCAYATENFAAMLTVNGGNRFIIESIGMRSLAKDYDRCRLYRVERNDAESSPLIGHTQ